MPHAFKLAHRLSRIRDWSLFAILSLAACSSSDSLTAPASSQDFARNRRTVVVTPTRDTLRAGQTVQLTATVTGGYGQSMAGALVTWTSSDTAIASVNASGLATALRAGSDTVTATSAGYSGISVITATPIPAPGTVTDLAVAATTDSSATLTFTEVSDGTGAPAQYDVRDAAGTVVWGPAPSVAAGTCASPVAGIAVGNKRSCTVLHLAAATKYQFQMVSFRGIFLVKAAFGGLSNIATGTTAASTGTGLPASIAISPASAFLPVGGTQVFSASVKDAAGNVLTGQTVTFSSGNTAIASVGSGTGIATGLAPGTATITAKSGAFSAGAVVTVNAPSVAEPTFRSGTDTMMWSDDFSQYTSSANLFLGYNQSSQNGGSLNLDKAIFYNDSQSLRIDWDSAGCLGGNDANVHIEKSVGKLDTHKEWVASYYTRFSAGYQFYWSAGGCSRGVSAKELVSYASGQTLNGKWSIVAHNFSSNELATSCPHIFQSGMSGGLLWSFFLDGSDSGTTFPSTSCASVAYPQHLAIGSKDPNSLVDGQWHHITLRTRKQSTLDAGDGIVQMWVDGVLVMNYDGTDASSPAYHQVFVRIQPGQYAPFWLAGIFNAGSPRAQSRWFDQVRFWYRPN